jgi:hypothetical protein
MTEYQVVCVARTDGHQYTKGPYSTFVETLDHMLAETEGNAKSVEMQTREVSDWTKFGCGSTD